MVGARYVRLSRPDSPFGWFAAFWFGIATYGILDAAWAILVPLVDPPLVLGIIILHLKILAGVGGFLGLVYYLLYIYTGDRRILWPLAAAYLAIYVFTVYSYAVRDPIGQAAGKWGSALVYANPEGVTSRIAYGLLFGPPLVASFAYAALLPRARTRPQQMRILATSGVLVVFFGGLLLGWLTEVVPQWPLIEKALAIAFGLALLRVAPRVTDAPNTSPQESLSS